VEARPANCRLAVTTNNRAIIQREADHVETTRHARDLEDDALALADRFGLSIGFHVPDQETYLAIVRAYADPAGLSFDNADALEWARRRGARSGRTAWQYVTELAGREGRALPW
jgi:predicted AAA+ superfamily ATPase